MIDRLRDRLWNFPLAEVKGWRYFWIKGLRIIYLAISQFFHHDSFLQASMLTYYTLLSITPIIAIALAIPALFGFNPPVEEALFSRFPEQKEVWTEVFSFAREILAALVAAKGITLFFSFLFLFYTATQMIGSLEHALNRAFEVKKGRTLRQMAIHYSLIIGGAPFVFAFLSAFFLLIGGGWSFLVFFFFALVYFVVPNRAIGLKPALFGGAIGAFFYLLVQFLYITFQVGLSRYSAIYGSFAALPLFLLWLQLSWSLLLLGAEAASALELLFYHELERKGEGITPRMRLLFSLFFTRLLIDEKSLSVKEVARRYELPYRLVEETIDLLSSRGIASSLGKGRYCLNSPGEEITVGEILSLLEGDLEGSSLEDPLFLSLKNALSSVDRPIRNTPLRDI